jgi:hypothetical protein
LKIWAAPEGITAEWICTPFDEEGKPPLQVMPDAIVSAGFEVVEKEKFRAFAIKFPSIVDATLARDAIDSNEVTKEYAFHSPRSLIQGDITPIPASLTRRPEWCHRRV